MESHSSCLQDVLSDNLSMHIHFITFSAAENQNLSSYLSLEISILSHFCYIFIVNETLSVKLIKYSDVCTAVLQGNSKLKNNLTFKP